MGARLPWQLVSELANEDVIAGLKDSTGSDDTLRQIASETAESKPAFSLLTGSETMFDVALQMGAVGGVPGLGNVDPGAYVRLYEAHIEGKDALARKEQERLIRLFRIVHSGDIGRLSWDSAGTGSFKAAMRSLGVIESTTVAPPLQPLTRDESRVVEEILADCGLL